MAKKKSKKNMLNIVFAIVVVALAVVTICTMFMPVFTTKTSALGGAVSNASHIKGLDVITAAFKGETSSDLSSGANALITLKNSDEAGAVTGIFCWMYFLTVVVSAAILVFAVLRIFGFRFKLVNSILGLAVIVLALVAFICGFVVASKFGSVDLGSWLSGKTVANVANYFMLIGVVAGGTNICLARRK